MKRSLLTLSVLSAMAFGGMAMAETPSYNYLQFGATEVDFDNGFNPDGYEFKWNYELNEDYYINADYTKVDDSGRDLMITDLGIGFKSDVTDRSSFFAQLDWTNMEFDPGIDDDGYRASVGVRSQLTADFEVKVAYEYLDINDDSSNIFVLGGAYNLTKELALTLDYKTESDFDQTTFGLRYNF